MIVTLLEVAGSLPRNTGSKAKPWNLHIWDPKGLYIWTPALHRFSRIHRVRAWRRTVRYVQLPRGWRSSTGSKVGLSGAVFSKPTRNRIPSVLLPVWGENTGGNQFHTKAIESSECAGSPLGPRREKWEPLAHSRAGASGLSGNPPVQILGTNRRQKMNAGPQPSWWRLVQAGVEFSFYEKLQLDCLQGSNWPCCSALSTRDRSQEGIEGGRGGFNLLAPLRNLMTQSCFPTNFPSTGSWLATIAAT